MSLSKKLTPIVLAGGKGTRMRPRTEKIPKPLLPVPPDGRPLLWYVVMTLKQEGFKEIVVSLDYLKECIKTYFEDMKEFFGIKFFEFSGATMAQAVCKIAQQVDSYAFLGLSSDVLISPQAIQEMKMLFEKFGYHDTVYFVKMPKPGHKKWEFVIENNRLKDIKVHEVNTNFERVLLIFKRDSLLRVIEEYGIDMLSEDRLPEGLKKYKSGWNLLLKLMLELDIPIFADILEAKDETELRNYNINVPEDLLNSYKFLKLFYRKGIIYVD